MSFTPEDFRTGAAFLGGMDMERAVDVLMAKEEPMNKYLKVMSHNSAIEPYLGFGARTVFPGISWTVVEVPEQHAQWLSDRLTSGMHWNRIFDTKDEAIAGSVAP